MRKVLLFLAMVVAVSAVTAQPTIATAIAPSQWNWYKQVESMRKKDEGHPWVSAVIKGINLSAGEMTISHGPIPNAKMPAMTMTFPVRTPWDLTAHRVGDRVRIQVADDGGVIRIVHIRSSKRR